MHHFFHYDEGIKETGCSLVTDEVGLGKSVSPLYATADAIDTANQHQARISIVCPHALRKKWHVNIHRQLAQHSHVIDTTEKSHEHLLAAFLM